MNKNDYEPRLVKYAEKTARFVRVVTSVSGKRKMIFALRFIWFWRNTFRFILKTRKIINYGGVLDALFCY